MSNEAGRSFEEYNDVSRAFKYTSNGSKTAVMPEMRIIKNMNHIARYRLALKQDYNAWPRSRLT